MIVSQPPLEVVDDKVMLNFSTENMPKVSLVFDREELVQMGLLKPPEIKERKGWWKPTRCGQTYYRVDLSNGCITDHYFTGNGWRGSWNGTAFETPEGAHAEYERRRVYAELVPYAKPRYRRFDGKYSWYIGYDESERKIIGIKSREFIGGVLAFETEEDLFEAIGGIEEDVKNYYLGIDETIPEESRKQNKKSGKGRRNAATWAPKSKQDDVPRSLLDIEFNGETRTLHEWSATTGIRYGTLYKRIYKLKWPIEKALTVGAKKAGDKNVRKK